MSFSNTIQNTIDKMNAKANIDSNLMSETTKDSSISQNKYKVGSIIEFVNDRDNSSGKYDNWEMYRRGQQGAVISVSDTKVVIPTPFEDEENYPKEYIYLIQLGMSQINNVPESDIFNPNASILDKVEKRLREKQENKEFKDTEGRIGGSKKEKSAYKMISMSNLNEIEEDEATAIELIKKDRVYPKVDVNDERNRGVSSGTAFLKVELRKSYSAQPDNSKTKRMMYVGYAEYLSQELKEIYTFDEFTKFIEKIKNEIVEKVIEIIRPELSESLLEEKEQNKQEYKRLSIEIQKITHKMNYFADLLYEKYPKANKNIWSEEIPEGENAQYFAYYSDRNILEKERQKFDVNASSSIEKSFLSSFGMSTIGRISYIKQILFKEMFGSRFTNMIYRSSDAVVETYETAKDYDPLSLPESLKLMEIDHVNSGKISLIKAKDLIERVKSLKTKSELDQYFITEKRGLVGYSGGDFALFRHPKNKKFFYYADLSGEEQTHAYKKRHLQALEIEYKNLEKRIESQEHKYRVRENNWDWAFDKKKVETSTPKADIKVNTYPPLSFIKRIGGIKIVEADISPDFIRQKFGFKEVEFGQSLKDTEAKEHVRHFLGAMSDLADILNMNVIELNKLGGLSIAFASRGGGKASAHYESLRKVINITKTRGGGAIAHEYMHYLDNILPKFNRVAYSFKEFASNIKEHKRYKYREKTIDNDMVFRKIDDIFRYIQFRQLPSDIIQEGEPEKAYVKKVIMASERGFSIPDSFNDGTGKYVKPLDIDDYFNRFIKIYHQYKMVENLGKRDIAILGAIVNKFGYKSYEFTFETKSTKFYAESMNRSSDYWSRPWELFARAFETYIYDKLNAVGRENNYLVSGAYFGYEVYPQGDERKVLFSLYNNLMEAIKTEYGISDFTAWTNERVDEYIALEGDKDETVEAGVIINKKTKKVVEKIANSKKIDIVKDKLKELLLLLSVKKMEQGGFVTNDTISDKFINYIKTI